MGTDLAGVLVGLGITLALILANAMFVFHEFAFVTLKPARLKGLAAGASRVGRLVSRGVKHLDHYIAVDQLGITVTSIAVGWIGQPLLAQLMGQALAPLAAVEPGIVSALGAVLAFLLITGTQMIVGELMPKTVALRHPERTAMLVALPVEVFARVAHPVVLLLNGLGRATVRLFGVTPSAESHAHVLPPEELAAIIQASVKAGVLAVDEDTLLEALRFSDLQARDVMVPRRDVVFLNVQMSVEEVFAAAGRSRHTRYPVYRENDDNVVGLLNIKDLVQCLPDGSCTASPADWQNALRPLPAVPELASIEHVLARLRQDRQHVSLVVDEYGSTAGIITVDDVVGRLVEGEDEEVPPAVDGAYELVGSQSIDEVEAALGISLGPPERDYQTIGGLTMATLGRVPAEGDRLQVMGHALTVLEMQGRRVARVRLRPAPDRATESPD